MTVTEYAVPVETPVEVLTEREQRADEVATDAERRARTLEAAALEIEVRGWATGPSSVYWWDGGAVCMAGGILAAMNKTTIGDYGVADYCSADRAWYGETRDCMSLWEFNDAAGRTADEVTFLLRWRAEEIRDGR